MISGDLNFLEPSGPLQACKGTALPYMDNTNVPMTNEFCNISSIIRNFKTSAQSRIRKQLTARFMCHTFCSINWWNDSESKGRPIFYSPSFPRVPRVYNLEYRIFLCKLWYLKLEESCLISVKNDGAHKYICKTLSSLVDSAVIFIIMHLGSVILHTIISWMSGLYFWIIASSKSNSYNPWPLSQFIRQTSFCLTCTWTLFAVALYGWNSDCCLIRRWVKWKP
jgi:hypothetical protein